MNPVFDLAKNFIVEGLSVRLDSYETTSKKDLTINIEPRVYYEVDGNNKSANHGLTNGNGPLNGLNNGQLGGKLGGGIGLQGPNNNNQTGLNGMF